MAIIVLIFPGAVSFIAMPALGAILILAGLRGVRIAELLPSSGLAGPPASSVSPRSGNPVSAIQAAVALGVVLSALLYLVRSSSEISVVELIKRDDAIR